jgi:hypothetical protein
VTLVSKPRQDRESHQSVLLGDSEKQHCSGFTYPLESEPVFWGLEKMLVGDIEEEKMYQKYEYVWANHINVKQTCHL